MDIKIFFAVLATVIGITSFFIYLRDIFSCKTKPHMYTWFIWVITQGTAVVGIWYGGGSWGALSIGIGTIFVIAIFLFSLKYGTKNITKGDTFLLIAALCAILIWWQLDKPLISILMISIIDVIGYFPSFRKTYQEPWSETSISWLMFSISNIFGILALREYSVLTALYLTTITIANITLFLLCFFRRRIIQKPQPQ